MRTLTLAQIQTLIELMTTDITTQEKLDCWSMSGYSVKHGNFRISQSSSLPTFGHSLILPPIDNTNWYDEMIDIGQAYQKLHYMQFLNSTTLPQGAVQATATAAYVDDASTNLADWSISSNSISRIFFRDGVRRCRVKFSRRTRKGVAYWYQDYPRGSWYSDDVRATARDESGNVIRARFLPITLTDTQSAILEGLL